MKHKKNTVKLQFSSYQLSDIQDTLVALDHVLEAASKLIYLKNHLKTTDSKSLVKFGIHQRVFVDLLKTLHLPGSGGLQKAHTNTKIITVIRAAFIFKKTREQFAKQKYTYHIILQHSAIPGFADLIVNILGLANFSAELKVINTF